MYDIFNKCEFIKESYYNEYIKEFALLSKEKTAYIYLRVSTKEQLELSPYAQLKDILKYCLDNEIWVPYENIFIDGGISGKSADNRVEFQNMINHALDKKNLSKLILVHKFDRFARNREESVLYKSKLKKYGIKVISVKEPLPEDKKMALILENQLETNSELYSINLSDEVYKGLRENAEQGMHQTRAPYGYKKIVKEVIKVRNRDKIIREMIINEEESKVILLIYEMLFNCTPWRQIARKLNDLGLKTRDGHSWYDWRIWYILNNVTYLGFTHWTEKNKETIIAKGTFPAIITQEMWDKKEKIVSSTKNFDNGKILKSRVKNEHWLRGKLRCSNCGNTLVINAGSWQCNMYTHRGCNESHSIRLYIMEELILKELNSLTADKIININISEIRIKNDNQLAVLEERLQQLKIKKKKIMTAYENDVYNLEEMKERKSIIEEEIILINDNINTLKKEDNYQEMQKNILKKSDNLYNLLIDEDVSIIDKRKALDLLIDKIVFDKKNKNLTFYWKGDL